MKNDINKANDTIQTKSMGRPKKDLDEDVIANLSQIGCTQEEIGAVVGISARTLQRRYADLVAENTNTSYQEINHLKEVLGNIRRKKTNMKKDNKNKQGIKDKGDNMEDIGENTFLKLREEKLRLKEELEQVKIQRDMALRKLKKIVEMINGNKKK